MDKFGNTPVLTEPRYFTSTPNESIRLYNGPVKIDGDDEDLREASINLVWLPEPRVEIEIAGFEADLSKNSRVNLNLCVAKELDVSWIRVQLSNARVVSTGIVGNPSFSDGVRFAKLIFHVANGSSYRGAAICNKERTKYAVSRAECTIRDWKVTIDALTHFIDKDVRRESKEMGGFLITHVGVIEQSGNERFEYEQVSSILESIRQFLSFCSGSWCDPMLSYGLDSNGKIVSESWSTGRTSRESYKTSWFPENSLEGFSILPMLHERLLDDIWSNAITSAIYWYVLCNSPLYVGVDGAIVLQQAAFELIAWTLLVQDRGVLSANGAEKLPAADKLRLLLSECKIPLDIPEQLQSLSVQAKAENWTDGPEATTSLRNSLVHMKPKKMHLVFNQKSGAMYQAWLLGQWYLELVILRLCNYNGTYLNRLKSGGWKSDAIVPVPWVE